MPVTLFEFVPLQRQLEKMLGRKVDFVVREALEPQLHDQILREVVLAREGPIRQCGCRPLSA